MNDKYIDCMNCANKENCDNYQSHKDESGHWEREQDSCSKYQEVESNNTTSNKSNKKDKNKPSINSLPARQRKPLFDFVIGNPPYQDTRGGTKNVDIWPHFIKATTQVAETCCLIHPGRWVVPKKQMRSVQQSMINSGLSFFNYYPMSTDVFKGVNVDGGITETIFKRGYDQDITFARNGIKMGKYNSEEIFLSNKFEQEAWEKTKSLCEIQTIEHRILGNVGSLAGGEFGYSKQTQIDKLHDSKEKMTDPVPIWANNSYGKGSRYQWHYIERQDLSNVPERLFTSRKIMLDKKGHAITQGRGNIINNIPQIVSANATASGDVLFVYPQEDLDYELQLIKSYFMTKTVRFLMSITQKDLYVRGFENVPDYTLFTGELNGQLFSDEWLWNYFDFSKELRSHIDNVVSPKEESSKADDE